MKWEYKVSEPYNLTNEEAINAIEKNMPLAGTYTVLTEALHMAIEALRKQEQETWGRCPCCWGSVWGPPDHCPNCGQRLIGGKNEPMV